jgi:Domain of unknown function (DUF4249)
MNGRHLIWIIIMVIAAGCTKPYNPKVISSPTNYLVVEGIINTGNDSTYIKLSRTVNLSTANTIVPELNALVTIQNDQNFSYTLQEEGGGLYATPVLNLSPTAKYRLMIKTSDGKEYLSDYVAAKATPSIDSISYSIQNGGVQFFVNSHDPQNNTRYYRWDFDETWEYRAFAVSQFKLGPDTLPVLRLPFLDSADDIYDCYKTIPSLQILLGSSAKLNQDVIYKQPINFVVPSSGKISHGYSVLVRQYALTADAFNYWQILQKNTEQLGSIFDAQPSSLTGNIHNAANAAEPVIGYVSASSVTTKRIYVDPTSLTSLGALSYFPPPDAVECVLGGISVAPLSTFKQRLYHTVGNGDTILLSAVQPIGAPAVVGYTYMQKSCADCRAKSPFGSNVKPVFFPSL